MRARAGLASALLKLGDVDGAVDHFRDMLRLNPNDNQGIRYILLGCLLSGVMTARSRSCWPHMRTMQRVFWLYTRALLAFRQGGESDEQAAALARDACAANEHVPAILAGTKTPVPSDSGYITMGGPDEATYYVTECGSAWHRTPGAVAWLTRLAAAAPKRRTPGRSIECFEPGLSVQF